MSALLPRRAAAIVAAAVPVHLALALKTDLSPDEAYYLCAARRGALLPELHDHPPLLPWLLRLTDGMGGPVELRVRLWAVLLSLAMGLGCVALARQRGADERGAELAAWVGTWALLPMAGGFVATPDGGALLGVIAALLALGSGRKRRVEAAVGALFLGALAKVVVVPIALGLAGAEWRNGSGNGNGNGSGNRRALVLGIGPLLALPLLVPSLRFQLHHAFAQTAEAGWTALGALGALGGAVSAQALLWSPPVLWIGVRALRRSPLGDRLVVIGLTGLVLLSALLRAVPPEPNWWAPAALVVVVAFAVAAGDLTARGRWAIVASVVVPTSIAVAHTALPFLPLPEKADPTARLHGWSRGHEPVEAPGVGAYGPAAERCVYRNNCSEIDSYFMKMQLHE